MTRMETKAAPATLEPPPTHGARRAPVPGATDVDPDTGEVTALVAVTGTVDEVGDIIEPGALAKSLRRRTPRLVVGHDWSRIAGRVVEARELMPDDPRLPRTAPDGTPWPREAGALWIRARYLPTQEGREQREVARAFGPAMNYSVGYKVTDGGAKHRNGVRHIHDLEIYEVSPVLHGAHRLATQLDVKSAAAPVREIKSTQSALRRTVATATCGGCGGPAAGSADQAPAGHVLLCPECVDQVDELVEHLAGKQDDDEQDDRTDQGDELDGDDYGASLPAFDDLDADPDTDLPDDPANALLHHLRCGLCGGPAGGQVGGLAPGDDLVCPRCVAAIGDLADELADRADDDEREPTTEEEYRTALADDVEYELLADGTIAVTPAGAQQGRAWRA